MLCESCIIMALIQFDARKDREQRMEQEQHERQRNHGKLKCCHHDKLKLATPQMRQR